MEHASSRLRACGWDGRKSRPGRRIAVALALFSFLVSGIAAAGGIDDPVVGDRPDFTESTETIAPRRVQLETGATLESGDSDVLGIGEALIRIGLALRWELRVGAGSWISVDDPAGDASGLDDPSFEAKFRINPGGDGTAVALLFGSSLSVGDEGIGAPDEQPFVKLLLGGELTTRLSWGANAGYARASEAGGRFDQLSGSFALGIGVNERLGTFVEVYGFSEEFDGGDTSVYADTGATYLLSDDLQVDTRIGAGLDGNEVDAFLGIGLIKRW